MTREEFLSLPPNIALGLIYDVSAAVQKAITEKEKPRSNLPPKFDSRLRRKNQRYVWASEATLESLTWELGRAKAEASEGGQWAEKAAKNAETLQRWVNWRTWEPMARWQGTRGNNEVHAMPPSKHPAMHDWEKREAKPAAAPPRGDAYEDDVRDEDVGDFPPDGF